MMMIRFAVAAAVVGIAAGCPPPPNFLDGSIKDSHDLAFTRVELRFLSDQLVFQLSYFNLLDPDDPSAGEDTVAKLTFNQPEGGVVVDKAIDIADPAAGAAVERVTAKNDPFPPAITDGEVTFHSEAKADETVKGEFAVTFDNGKTLFGAFETKEEEASF